MSEKLKAVFNKTNLMAFAYFVLLGSFVTYVTLMVTLLSKIDSNEIQPGVQKYRNGLMATLVILPVSMIMPIIGLLAFLSGSSTIGSLCVGLGILLCLGATLGMGILSIVYGSKTDEFPELEPYKHIMKSIGSMIIIFFILFVFLLGMGARRIYQFGKALKNLKGSAMQGNLAAKFGGGAGAQVPQGLQDIERQFSQAKSISDIQSIIENLNTSVSS